MRQSILAAGILALASGCSPFTYEEAETGFVVKEAVRFNSRGTPRETLQPYRSAGTYRSNRTSRVLTFER